MATKTTKTQTAKKANTKFVDTGLKVKDLATVVIPGRGRVTVPAPLGDLYFKSSLPQDTGLASAQVVKPIPDYTRLRPSTPFPMPPERIKITGVLTRKDYLYLVRRGCTIEEGFLLVPQESIEAVHKYLKIKE